MVGATQQQQQQQPQQQPQQQQKQKQTTAAVGASKPSTEEETLKKNTDCVYFLASPLTCKKGSECEYRHSEYARINPRDCYYWLNGNCLNPKCGFRHPPLDGLLGTQVAASAGSSMSASQMAVTPTNTAHTPYNQGASYNPSKQPVQCIFFQKGYCFKGDRCTFLHGPTANNKALQPAAPTPAAEPNFLKKTFGAPEMSQVQKLPPANVPRTVGIPPEVKAAPKVEAVSSRSGAGIEKNMQRPPYLDEELPRHKGTNIASVVNGGSVSRSNRLHHASEEQGFHAGKDTDEFLRESSPGFDVLVDDELRASDFYHGEDQYGGTRGLEGRNVNEYDIGLSANYDAMAGVDREMFRDALDYDSFDQVQGHYDWDRPRASSERISLGQSTLERRGYSRADSPDHIESDLRYRLTKHRRVNGLRSVVSHDHDLENHEEERHRGSFRDSHHLPSHEGSVSNRLRGRIKIPGRSLVNGADLRSEREIERGRSWGRLSPGKPQTSSHQGRLRDRIKGRVEADYNIKEGRNFRGPRIRREIMDEMNADFEGPKSLSELRGGRNPENKDQLSLGKRKHMNDYRQTEGDASFEGPMPLSEILKKKRQSEAASSGVGIASVNEEDINQKQSKESLTSGSPNLVESATLEQANGKEEMKSTIADGGAAAHGESSQLDKVHETEDGMVGDERMEDHELEADDQQEGDYYYEQGDEGEYEEGENVDHEEEYVEEEDGEDGDDFEKKLGVMFS